MRLLLAFDIGDTDSPPRDRRRPSRASTDRSRFTRPRQWRTRAPYRVLDLAAVRGDLPRW